MPRCDFGLLWWIVVPRRYYTLENGKEVAHGHSAEVEMIDGAVRIPMQANFRRPGSKWVTVQMQFQMPQPSQAEPLGDICSRIRQEIRLLQCDVGCVAALCGGIEENAMSHLDATEADDATYEQAIRSQLRWLHGLDVLTIDNGSSR